MAQGKITVAALQFAGLPENKELNIEIAFRLAREAAGKGAKLLVTPECVLTGFTGGEQELKAAETIPGPTVERFAGLAKELKVQMVVGLAELDGENLYNAAAIIDANGTLTEVMRKVHINRYETHLGWTNGSKFPVWDLKTDTGEAKVGIMICYDRELPESARLLMLQGADLIVNPMACECPVADIHRALLRTRAFENETYVLAVNQAAPTQNGHSLFIDPRGTIVSEAGTGEQLLLGEIDLDALNRQRKTGLYGLHHRRPELYSLLCDPAGQIHPPEARLPRCQ